MTKPTANQQQQQRKQQVGWQLQKRGPRNTKKYQQQQHWRQCSSCSQWLLLLLLMVGNFNVGFIFWFLGYETMPKLTTDYNNQNIHNMHACTYTTTHTHPVTLKTITISATIIHLVGSSRGTYADSLQHCLNQPINCTTIHINKSISIWLTYHLHLHMYESVCKCIITDIHYPYIYGLNTPILQNGYLPFHIKLFLVTTEAKIVFCTNIHMYEHTGPDNNYKTIEPIK